MTNTHRLIAIILLIFNGISAIAGGWALIAAPDGAILQMPVEMLRYSPFSNFLVPGIILFVMNGILSIIVGIFSILRWKNYHFFIICQGYVLLGWIVIQIGMIRSFHILHVLYGLTGLILIVLGMLIKNDILNTAPQ
jgi:hypothetical protein